LEVSKTYHIPLEKLILRALEIDRRALTNRVKASFTPVGNSADSPQPILRPSPVTGLDPNIVDVEKPYVGYDAETCLYQPP
jgi:hypothetical protein